MTDEFKKLAVRTQVIGLLQEFIDMSVNIKDRLEKMRQEYSGDVGIVALIESVERCFPDINHCKWMFRIMAKIQNNKITPESGLTPFKLDGPA